MKREEAGAHLRRTHEETEANSVESQLASTPTSASSIILLSTFYSTYSCFCINLLVFVNVQKLNGSKASRTFKSSDEDTPESILGKKIDFCFWVALFGIKR